MIQERMELAIKPNLGDYTFQIPRLHLQGMKKHKKVVAKVFDAFLEKIINEYIQSKDENRTKYFVDVTLCFKGSEETERMIEREQTKGTILLGLTIVKQGTAHLVHCFDWELHEGMLPTGLDMLEEFSLVTPWAKHLSAIPSYCLNI
ncbi:hypothetical protein KPL70_021907 [Citrus sinensis]|nr:hypothetical protein KPL70_021907 [Citrus sinensis]